MGPVQTITTCLRKSFTFSGRASRSEFWWFVLSINLLIPIAGLVDYWLFGTGRYLFMYQEGNFQFEIFTDGVFTLIFPVLSLISILTAAARRLHDNGRSGHWLFLPLLLLLLLFMITPVMLALFGQAQGQATIMTGFPALIVTYLALSIFLGLIAILFWLASPSQPGPNRYGPNPVEVTP